MPVIPVVVSWVVANSAAIVAVAAVGTAVTTGVQGRTAGKVARDAAMAQEKLGAESLRTSEELERDRLKAEEKLASANLQQQQIETLANIQQTKDVLNKQSRPVVYTTTSYRPRNDIFSRFNNWFSKLFGG